MCLYGGLQLSISSNIYVLPCQIWLSTTFPVEAPVIYLVAQEGPTKIVKIHSNHPVVDCTGRCYSRGLCRWDPLKSLLKDAITELLQSLRKSGVSPLVVEELTKTEKDKIGDPLSDDDDCCVVCYGQRDTVMVPCGHFCLCSSCAANVLDCPMCRTKIKFRQKIIV
ncbi:hypothetical protein AGDE_04894 [Angomonas deanei]|nr:hypothetical protein AGDE_04894 [Angomonas deanei]|eukprot:EPY39035.1 hypothetical protein AGDE_04894 [Angomonas deanei]